ncbi:MAG: hypothetical protein U9R27_03335 [Campylobacterota bacterium]|nr:hypothetical protein [Campylobacterota bacterium]
MKKMAAALLTLLFSAHLFASMMVVDTISDLKKISNINTNDKIIVDVLGYYLAGDGGGGSFYLDKNFRGTFDDGINIKTNISRRYAWRRLYAEPVNVKWFGAKGNGLHNDTQPILQSSKYQYVFFPMGSYLSNQHPESLNATGPGEILLKMSDGTREETGNFIYAGSIKSRGGERRADMKGGLFIGGDLDDRRGVQLHTEVGSAWAFMKERSPSGQSLLLTLQPNPLTVNAESKLSSNQVIAKVNDFSSKNWAKDDIVHFNKQSYRIKSIGNNGALRLSQDDKNRSNVFFGKKIRDNLVLPAFYFNINADIENSVIKRLSGDLKHKFSAYDYNQDRVSALIDGKWYRIKENGPVDYTYRLKNTMNNRRNIPVVLKLQPEYTMQLSLKKTSGQGLEETLAIMSSADGWRYKSSGSGVALNKPHIFRVGNKDILFIDEESVTSNKDLNILGDGYFRDKVVINKKRLTWQAGYGSPEGMVTAPVGSLYSRINGGRNTTLYIKERGNEKSGWRAK